MASYLSAYAFGVNQPNASCLVRSATNELQGRQPERRRLLHPHGARRALPVADLGSASAGKLQTPPLPAAPERTSMRWMSQVSRLALVVLAVSLAACEGEAAPVRWRRVWWRWRQRAGVAAVAAVVRAPPAAVPAVPARRGWRVGRIGWFGREFGGGGARAAAVAPARRPMALPRRRRSDVPRPRTRPAGQMVVQALNGAHVYFAGEMDNQRRADADVTFPTGSWQNVTMRLRLRCPSEPLRLLGSLGLPGRGRGHRPQRAVTEIMRFVTPYRLSRRLDRGRDRAAAAAGGQRQGCGCSSTPGSARAIRRATAGWSTSASPSSRASRRATHRRWP